MIVYKQFRKNPSCLQPPWIKHINAFIWASCTDMAGPIKMTFHLSKKIIHNMWRQFHRTHLERNGLEFNYRAKISPFFPSSGLRAISTNKMSWSSATMWPSNNTWLWLHLLMGEKWVFYITVISVRVDRAKTLNPPPFNLLDQFSSTYTPLRKCRIITGYLHFILIFTHKKKKSLTSHMAASLSLQQTNLSWPKPPHSLKQHLPSD